MGFDSSAYLSRLLNELDRAAISIRLKQSREEAGLTQPEMADALSTHWRTIQNYENAKLGRIPWDRLDEWARVTGRTKEWLLHGEEAMSRAEEVAEFRAEIRAIRVMLETLFADRGLSLEAAERDADAVRAAVRAREEATRLAESARPARAKKRTA